MPVYEYECPTGHTFERIVLRAIADEPKELAYCKGCRTLAKLKASRTGKPILKAGSGGFYSPNA